MKGWNLRILNIWYIWKTVKIIVYYINDRIEFRDNIIEIIYQRLFIETQKVDQHISKSVLLMIDIDTWYNIILNHILVFLLNIFRMLTEIVIIIKNQLIYSVRKLQENLWFERR